MTNSGIINMTRVSGGGTPILDINNGDFTNLQTGFITANRGRLSVDGSVFNDGEISVIEHRQSEVIVDIDNSGGDSFVSTGELSFVMKGTTARTFSNLKTTGGAADILDGVIWINLTDGYAPLAGDAITILTNGTTRSIDNQATQSALKYQTI